MMLCFAPQFLGVHGLKPMDFDGYIHDAGQPTVHFNVLRERGLDTRLVRVDETAPVWYIDKTPDPSEIPSMLILYADNDITNRPEQLSMMITAMKHFGYPMEKIESHQFTGCSHCQYNCQNDENGENILSKYTDYLAI